MSSPLLLNNGDNPTLELTSADGVVTVYRGPARCVSEALSYLLILAAATVVAAGQLLVVCLAIWTAVVDGEALALLLLLPFGIGFSIGIWGWLIIQGYLFSFKVIVGNDQYRIENGVVRYSRPVQPGNASVVIYPSQRGQDWGYSAYIELPGRTFGFPFVEPCIVGTKREAQAEAVRLRDWLLTHSSVGTIAMSGWGKIDGAQTRSVDPVS
jgi:hypothetical protein